MLQKEPLFPIKNNFLPYRNVESVLEYGDPCRIKNPKVSIIVPIFNHPEYLEETLMSLINQDYQEEYEIIVVDNNMSQPHSPNYNIIKTIDSPKVLYYRHAENIKFEGNCNRGVELARANYISFCHDDDLFLPDALSTLMQIQEQTGDRCIIASFYVIDNNSNDIAIPYFNPDLDNLYVEESLYWLIEKSARLQIGSLWNKEKFIASGGYSPGQAPCQDYGLHAIYGSKYGCINCLRPTFKYRKANNASKELCKLFPEREKYIMNDLCEKIHWIPRFFLNIVISIAIKRVIIGNIDVWGTDQAKPEFSITEKIASWVNWYIYNKKRKRRKTNVIIKASNFIF